MSYGGGFDNSGETPSRGGSSDGKARRNYDEQTLIPCTVKMIMSALGDPNGEGAMTLKDGRPLHMVKVVAAVRQSEERSTNVFIDIEDGTGFTQVKIWVNEGDDASAITQFRQAAGQEHTYIRIIGQVRDFDGKRQIIANDIRPLTTGNELTYHLLEVAHSFEKSKKMQSDMQTMGAMGMNMGGGVGIGNMASGPQGGGMGVKAEGMGGGMGGGNALNDTVIQVIKQLGVGSDSGVHINNIIAHVQGYSEGEVRSAINVLSNEGLIYSTIDEDNFQFAE